MPQNGKFSRALAKGGAGSKLAAASPGTGQTTAPPATEPDTNSVRRVKVAIGSPEFRAVMITDRGSEAAAQIRALRAKILALNEGNPPRVITVTSGSRDEGKTTVAFNLAAALSEIETGRVILIDGDMLRPNLHILLNMNPTTGLNNIFQDNRLPLDNNIYETPMDNLDVIPTEATTPETHDETFLHQNCARLLAKLRKLYAFVIIDTPPVMAGSQASAFGKHSDGVIIIARLEKTPRHVVKRAANEVLAAGAKVLGCFLTHHTHHVPDFIYRFFGTTPTYYYRYGRHGDARRAKPPDTDKIAPPDIDESAGAGKN